MASILHFLRGDERLFCSIILSDDDEERAEQIARADRVIESIDQMYEQRGMDEAEKIYTEIYEALTVDDLAEYEENSNMYFVYVMRNGDITVRENEYGDVADFILADSCHMYGDNSSTVSFCNLTARSEEEAIIKAKSMTYGQCPM